MIYFLKKKTLGRSQYFFAQTQGQNGCSISLIGSVVPKVGGRAPLGCVKLTELELISIFVLVPQFEIVLIFNELNHFSCFNVRFGLDSSKILFSSRIH